VAAAAAAAAAAETGPSRVLTAERYYAEITASTGALAGLVDGAELTLQVPTCPDWTLRQLATHVGRAQRWAAEIVSTRSRGPSRSATSPTGGSPTTRPGTLAGCARARTG